MFDLLHNFVPQPVLFSWGPLTLYWYGLFVVSGILVGLKVIVSLAKKYNISSDEVFDAGFYVIIFGLIGARIYSVFLDFPYYLQNPTQVIAVWNGGLAIHGALIGGALAGFFYLKRKKQNFWQWADIVAPGIALGQAFGRFGNYFNQEIFGPPTGLPWGIPIEFKNRPLQHLEATHFHPTFLYESILNLINFAVLYYLYKKKKLKTGNIFLIYLINYSVIRILMETLRTDRAPEIFGLRWPVLASIVLILFCVSLLYKRKGLTVKKP